MAESTWVISAQSYPIWLLPARRVDQIKQQVGALLWSLRWWQPSGTDWMSPTQIKVRICKVRSVFPGGETKIADMLISHSRSPSWAWKHIKGHTLTSFHALHLTERPFCLHSWASDGRTIGLLCSSKKKDNYLQGQVPVLSCLVSNYWVVNSSVCFCSFCISPFSLSLFFILMLFLSYCQALALELLGQ